MGRPREHGEQTREALLTAAESLIDRDGVDGLSVRAVADQVGTTTRAVYSLFGSKLGLLEALAARFFELLAAAVASVPRTDDPVADVVEASVRGFRATAHAHAALYRIVFVRSATSLEFGTPFETAAAATFEVLVEAMRRVDATVGLGGNDPVECARAVHALTEGLATDELRNRRREKDADAVARWRRSVGALLAGFTSTD